MGMMRALVIDFETMISIRKTALFLLPALLAGICFACSENNTRRAEQSIAKYSGINSDLAKILERHAGGDKDHYRAACFILANLTEEDARILDADSVIASIDCALEVWRKTPWASAYRFDTFLEYVLPLRVASEPLEYFWRWDAASRFGRGVSPEDSLHVAVQKVNNTIAFTTYPELFKNKVQKYSVSATSLTGKCDDRTVVTVMAMRAHGIPAARHFIPYWGSSNNGHSFCSVIQPDGSCRVFQNTTDEGENAFFARKVPKIYRKMFSVQEKTALYKYRDTEEIPPEFSDFRRMDVTDSHQIGFADLEVKLTGQGIENRMIYLCVFSPAGWIPVACTERSGGKALFRAVGTGTDAYGNSGVGDVNAGDGILYLPCYYAQGEFIPAANLLIHKKNGGRTIEPSSQTEKVTLHRKFPLRKRIEGFAQQMVGGVFEGANRADFSDAEELHYIYEIPLPRMQRVTIDHKGAFRYIRYRKAKGTFSLGEIKCFDAEGRHLSGRLIADNTLRELPELAYISDNDPLTYISVQGMFDGWAGLQFDRGYRIGAIEFCPRNDDNNIYPGNQYELYYWDDEWITLGRKIAEDYSLQFDDVPQGALLRLRNLTRGKEERPFTYENGTQVWW